MKQDMKEHLSALVDNELDELEEHRVLAALANDSTLRDVWERYHLVRAALHQDLEFVVPHGLAQRVAQRIATEPAATAAYQRRPIMRLIGTLAIAASVATIAIVGVQWYRQPAPVPLLTLAANQPAPRPVPAAVTVPAAAKVIATGTTRWDTKQPEAEQALNAYLVEHDEFASTAGIGGIMPYVRVVSYDQR
ncbi:MAG: sigma-E factor negative regulatory protein [Sulfuricaulis sp.]